jgi:formate hydrogenlyase subunit 3/multisubunit Na+/H+ antiporter MnhD subunit
MNNIQNLIIIPILLPFISAILILLTREKTKYLKEFIGISVTLISLLSAITALKYVNSESDIIIKLQGIGILSSLQFKIDQLSAFLLTGVSLFSFLISMYGISVKNKGESKIFYFLLLLTQSQAAGAVTSDNLILMLFFWESMIITLYLFIYISGETNQIRMTALKAFLINGISDIALMVGIIIVGYITSTFLISEISSNKLIVAGWGTLAYILLLIGALTKAGAFPFHTWIPEAALNSNAAFMAYIPAAIDKLLGIYFLARITLHLYTLNHTMQLIVMSIGAITIIVAVMMAFVQSDYKRLLSYHAVSQTGYMILGISTLNPIGIAGGLFHMINHAVYKSCLFMTSGAVERQAGTNDLTKLGGLFKKMPITAICFIIAAASISGIAPFNGFFSKELIYKGTLLTGYTVFFIAAEIGSILTLASFLKLGHNVYFEKPQSSIENVKEAPLSMLIPMIILATICIVFGFGAHFPIKNLISPALMSLGYVEGELAGFHFDNLFLISLVVILIALSNHIYGYMKTKRAYKSSDHIHYAPILSQVYNMAEKGYFDLYEIFRKIFDVFRRILFKTDRTFDSIIDKIPSKISNVISISLSKINTGSYSLYMFFIIFFAVIYVIYLGGIKW